MCSKLTQQPMYPSITMQVTLQLNQHCTALLYQGHEALGQLFECRDIVAYFYTVWDSPREWSKCRVTHVHKNLESGAATMFPSVYGSHTLGSYSKQLSHSQFIVAKDYIRVKEESHMAPWDSREEEMTHSYFSQTNSRELLLAKTLFVHCHVFHSCNKHLKK